MKTYQDIVDRVKMEVELWFPKQCRETFEDYYWWYMETTPEHDGGFLIAKDKPANEEYFVAAKLRKNMTKDQNAAAFLAIARKLPILAMERQEAGG